MLDTDGYRLYPAVFTTAEMDQLADKFPAVERGGTRSLLDDEHVLRVAGDPRLRALVGPEFFAVRALLFDKTAESNWGLRWHQDVSVASASAARLPPSRRGRSRAASLTRTRRSACSNEWSPYVCISTIAEPTLGRFG